MFGTLIYVLATAAIFGYWFFHLNKTNRRYDYHTSLEVDGTEYDRVIDLSEDRDK